MTGEGTGVGSPQRRHPARPPAHRWHVHVPPVTYPLQLLILLLQLGLHLPQPLLNVAVSLLGLSANTA